MRTLSDDKEPYLYSVSTTSRGSSCPGCQSKASVHMSNTVMMARITLKSICILVFIIKLSTSNSKANLRARFLVTDVADNNPLKYYPEGIRIILPASSETVTSFRYNLTGLTSFDRDVLYNLSSSHVLCAGCYGTSSDFQAHECNNGVIVCKTGSACISGSIIDYHKAYHQDAIKDTPDAYPYKGCCDPTTSHCQLTVKSVQTCAARAGCNHHAYYQLSTCTGYMCNAPESFFRTSAPDIHLTRTSKVGSVTLTTPQGTTPVTHVQATTAKTTPVTTHVTNPPSISCLECTNDTSGCEHTYQPVTCSYPNNYCINDLTNNGDASRVIIRRCGNYDECVNDWWQTYSDNELCKNFNQDTPYNVAFNCKFCCVKDACNEKINPPKETNFVKN